MQGPPGNMGTETRDEILPKGNINERAEELPNYDFAANIPTPGSIGVRRVQDAGFGDILNSSRGILYYTDLIGFGEASSPMTRNLPFRKIGINYFMKSGMQCPNGADMYTYFKGIPDGSALGTTLQKAIKSSGMPELRGLAPGILEDMKEALNPNPMLQAAIGNVYPDCELKRLQVGDSRGYTRDPETGDVWVRGSVETGRDGLAYQSRWVQKTDAKGNPIFITQKEFNERPKTHNPDGTLKKVEGFGEDTKTSLLLAVVFFCAAFAIHKSK